MYTFLDTKFVDQFFDEGSLRLSSFSRFKKHEDEQRLDAKEGEALFVHRTSHMGGQSLSARAQHGSNAYVLCATIRYEKELMEAFGCNSYLRINNPTQFGIAISRHIPGFVGGLEGNCLYQENKIIERDLGYIDLKQFPDPDHPVSTIG
jgi:hypothetical protein